jgi:lysozyme
MKVTKLGKKGFEVIKSFEGFESKPYLCSAGVATIGWGSTRYADGSKVKLTDQAITQAQADELFLLTLTQYELDVDAFCRDDISQNQFDALTSFCYNCGAKNLKSSTLLKKVNKNPNDPTIKAEFLKWNKASGKVLKGLVRRREAEANLYFS